MELNKDSKNVIRQYFVEQLQKVLPEKGRVPFDKKLLEELIFDKYKLGNGKVVKVPVWTGEFLSKIDLSEVSFDDVVWDDDLIGRKIEYYSDDPNYRVNLFITNAKIDFSKAYWGSKESKCLSNLSFFGTDLSNSNIDIIDSFKQCNFTCSKINIDSKDRLSKFENCNLFSNDLSKIEIYIMECYDMIKKSISLNGNNISGTGLKFTIDVKLDKKDVKLCETLKDKISKGYFSGCYINGVRILTETEQEEKKKQILTEYRRSVEHKTKKYIFDEIEGYLKGIN